MTTSGPAPLRCRALTPDEFAELFDTLCAEVGIREYAGRPYSAASLTQAPLETGQAAQSSPSAWTKLAIWASECTGDGVRRNRSVPFDSVG